MANIEKKYEYMPSDDWAVICTYAGVEIATDNEGFLCKIYIPCEYFRFYVLLTRMITTLVLM
jgi:hypothetical protein